MREPSIKKWIETGYELFAQEGPEGIQVERLARIVGLNKSGFYHYFGDMETFSKELIKHHRDVFDQFLIDVAGCKTVDPEYAVVLLKHKVMVMAQMHLVRNKSNPMFTGAHKELDDRVNHAVMRIWSDHLEIQNNPDLILQYHGMIRDMFYSRISWQNFNFEFLIALADEAKEVVTKIHNERVKFA